MNENLPAEVQRPLSVQDVIGHVRLVEEILKEVMKEGEHFGVIPGTDKPTLYQPGAQKLGLTFRLVPKYKIEERDLGLSDHREYEVVCELYSSSGDFVGEGVGVCSTMESKYRYRSGPKEFLGELVPKDYWKHWKTDPGKAQETIGGKGFSVAKNPDTGQWEIVERGERIENADPADTWNTVKKMAKKRAFVDAILTRTAASDIFTQDLEDFTPSENEKPKEKPKTTKGKDPKEEEKAPQEPTSEAEPEAESPEKPETGNKSQNDQSRPIGEFPLLFTVIPKQVIETNLDDVPKLLPRVLMADQANRILALLKGKAIGRDEFKLKVAEICQRKE